MPRPKRTKIISSHNQKPNAAIQKAVVHSNPSASRTHHSKSNIQTHNDENEVPSDPKSTVPLSSNGDIAHQKRHPRGSLKDDATPSTTDDVSAPEVQSPKSSQRPPLQDITSQQRSPLKDRLAGRSPWATSTKAPMQLEHGFEEFLRSSSPQLPPTTISRPLSAIKPPGTPSFLSIANFKRRPRQPSILRMVQQDTANHNEDEAEDLTLGSLGHSSPPYYDALPTQHGPDNLPSSGTKRKASALEPEDEDEEAAGVDGTAEHDDLPERTSLDLGASLPALPQRSTVSATTKPFKKTPPPRRRGRRVRQKRSSTVIAPSSSPPNSASSPHSTPPPEQAQPQVKSASEAAVVKRVSKRRQNNQTTADPQTVTTASLKEHLPKGRTRAAKQRQQESFDNLGSSDEEAEDEQDRSIAFTDDDDDGDSEEFGRSKPKRQQTKQTSYLRSKPTKGEPAKSRSTVSRPTKAKRQASATSHRQPAETSKSDEENDKGKSFFDGDDDGDDDDDETETTFDADAAAVRDTLSKSKELADAKKKFAEVDDWELSFESCDVQGGSSSPWR